VCMYVCMFVCMYVCMYACKVLTLLTDVAVYVCASYGCMYVCMYVFKFKRTVVESLFFSCMDLQAGCLFRSSLMVAWSLLVWAHFPALLSICVCVLCVCVCVLCVCVCMYYLSCRTNHTDMSMLVYVRIPHMHVCVSVYMYVCMCVCMYVCAFLHVCMQCSVRTALCWCDGRIIIVPLYGVRTYFDDLTYAYFLID